MRSTCNKPQYFKYFTQLRDNHHFDFSWVLAEDLGWVDELNNDAARKFQKIFEETGKREGIDYFSSEAEHRSKDFGTPDFPAWHEWPPAFLEKYNNSVEFAKNEIRKIVKTATSKITLDNLTIYLNCSDGNHYFSAESYDNNSIELASIEEDSNFDCVDTAVRAFITDHETWSKKFGELYRKTNFLLSIEALRKPLNFDESGSCQHEDLGSLGYKHGEIIKCPFCNKLADVW